MDALARLKILSKLAVAFNAPFPEARAEIYLDAIEGIRTESLEWAVNQSIKRHEFFPVPAKLIELCNASPRIKPLEIEYVEPMSEEQRIENMRKLDELMKTFDDLEVPF